MAELEKLQQTSPAFRTLPLLYDSREGIIHTFSLVEAISKLTLPGRNPGEIKEQNLSMLRSTKANLRALLTEGGIVSFENEFLSRGLPFGLNKHLLIQSGYREVIQGSAYPKVIIDRINNFVQTGLLQSTRGTDLYSFATAVDIGTNQALFYEDGHISARFPIEQAHWIHFQNVILPNLVEHFYDEENVISLVKYSTIVRAILMDIIDEHTFSSALEKLPPKTQITEDLPAKADLPKKGGGLGEILGGNLKRLIPGETLDGVESFEDLDLLNKQISKLLTGTEGQNFNLKEEIKRFLEKQGFFGLVSDFEVIVILNKSNEELTSGQDKVISYLLGASLSSTGRGMVGKYLGEVSFFIAGSKRKVVKPKIKHLQSKDGIAALDLLLDASTVIANKVERENLRNIISAGLPSLGKKR